MHETDDHDMGTPEPTLEATGSFPTPPALVMIGSDIPESSCLDDTCVPAGSPA